MAYTQPENQIESQELLQKICTQSSLAMIAADAEMKIVFWNNAACELLGKNGNSQCPDTKLHDLFGSQHSEKLLASARKSLTSLQTTQCEIHKEAEGNKDFLIVMSAVSDHTKIPRGIAAWIIDQTEHKRLVSRLTMTEKLASLGTLARGLAHHFNSILGGISSFVDQAIASDDKKLMKRALQMTSDAAARISKITQSLMSFTNEEQPADLADLTEVILTFSHLIEKPLAEKNIRLNLELRPSHIIPVEANRMNQVLGNLLSNAEEAMPNGGQIDLYIGPDENEEFIVRFSDSGCGIAANDYKMVFEPFFTTKKSMDGKTSSPGLGLSIVQGLLAEMGGVINLETTEKGGAAFVIRFPAAKDYDLPEDDEF